MAYRPAKGTFLNIYSDASAWERVFQVVDLTFGQEGDTVDVTSHDSTVMAREYIGGTINRTLTFTLSWDAADTYHGELEDAMVDRTPLTFQLEHQAGTEFTAEHPTGETTLLALDDYVPVDGNGVRFLASGDLVGDLATSTTYYIDNADGSVFELADKAGDPVSLGTGDGSVTAGIELVLHRFAGVLESFTNPAPVDGKLEAQVTVRVTGNVTRVPALGD